MAYIFKVETDSRKLEAKLAAMAGADLERAFRVVGSVLLQRIKVGFKLGQSPDGQAWAPIKFRKLARNEKGKVTQKGRNQRIRNIFAGVQDNTAGKPLRDTGRFSQSFTAQADKTGVTVGTKFQTDSGAGIARVHQFGAVIRPKRGPFLVFPGPTGGLIFAKKVTIPARPFLPITQGGEIKLPQSWSNEVTESLKRFIVLKAQGIV